MSSGCRRLPRQSVWADRFNKKSRTQMTRKQSFLGPRMVLASKVLSSTEVWCWTSIWSQAFSASVRRLCANNPFALNAVGLRITHRGGDLSRTQMEGLKFKLCYPFLSALSLKLTAHRSHTWWVVMPLKGRHSAVISYLLQQINGMLFSQDVQWRYWSRDKRKPLVKFCISKAGDEKWWNWRTCVVSALDQAD